jgi:gliding motility-associated-like protein
LCTNGTLLLDASTSGADQYTWNTGEKTAQIKVDSARVYAVEVRSFQQCFTLFDSIRIAFKKALQVMIVSDSSKFCDDGTWVLEAKASEELKFLWSTGETSESIEVTSAGTYTVETTNSCGKTVAEIKIELPDCPKDCPIFVPNAFTPNNDGVNDQFGPLGGECLNYQRYQFRVYSRWGELVYEGRSPSEKWDGSFKGMLSPSDVYVWTLEYTTSAAGTVKKSGDIGLLR